VYHPNCEQVAAADFVVAAVEVAAQQVDSCQVYAAAVSDNEVSGTAVYAAAVSDNEVSGTAVYAAAVSDSDSASGDNVAADANGDNA
jgi:hypothetical protein